MNPLQREIWRGVEMKIGVLDSKEELPLIDLLGGHSGQFAGNLPIISFERKEKSEYFLSPHDWWDIKHDKEYLEYLIRMSNEKTVLLSNRNDFPGNIDSNNVIYLQNTIEIGGSTNRRLIVPYNVRKPFNLELRDFSTKPVVSFVGYLPRVTMGRILRSVCPTFHPISKNSAIVRALGLKQIKLNFQNAQLHTNKFYGGARSQIRGNLNEHRERFILSINSSDIVFCPRGDANGSQRFYETLASGRIPLIPDTKIRIPKNLQWNDFAAIKIRPTMFKVVTTIEQFWNQLDSHKYLKLQKLNREIFDKQLEYRHFMETMFKTKSDIFEAKYVY